MSLPVVDSPTNIFLFGFITLINFSICFIRFSFVYILPAVSINKHFILFFSAYFFASNATDVGSVLYSPLIIGTLSFSACSSNCSIAAALNVSAAAKTQEILLFFRRFAIFAMLVVFPVPLIPKKRIVYVPSYFFISSIKFGEFIKTPSMAVLIDWITLFLISLDFDSCPTNEFIRFSFILSTTPNATLCSSNIISSSSNICSTCCFSILEVVNLLRIFEKNPFFSSFGSFFSCSSSFISASISFSVTSDSSFSSIFCLLVSFFDGLLFIDFSFLSFDTFFSFVFFGFLAFSSFFSVPKNDFSLSFSSLNMKLLMREGL